MSFKKYFLVLCAVLSFTSCVTLTANEPKTVTLPPIHINVQPNNPIYPHQLPFIPMNPFNKDGKLFVFPSNQDIKDGIQRPDDTLRYGLYKNIGGAGYDYYSESRSRTPRP